MTDRHTTTSLWHGTAQVQDHPPLRSDTDTDVVVVGAGITGLTTALALLDEGLRVTVLEARHVAAGTTGGTTGKLTSQHGLLYRSLRSSHGADAARRYADANQAAIGQLRELCTRHGIDADLTPADAYVYAEDGRSIAALRNELDVVQQLGLPAEWVDTTELPFPVAGAVRFTDQAQLHAVKLCDGAARAIAAAPNGAVHCGTRVRSVGDRAGRIVVRTEQATVTADHAVLATLLPITIRGFEFARNVPQRSYGIAAPIAGDVPAGMYISAGEPSRSVRHYRGADTTYLVVVGQGHEVGHARGTSHELDALAGFAREHFDVGEIAFRWSAQDYVPDDRLPFVGTTAMSRRIHVATGFQKWGLTNAVVAAGLLTDTVQARPNPLSSLFSPRRLDVRASARRFLGHNADVVMRFVGDRLRPEAGATEHIPRGGGATVRVDGELRAVSRDDDGTLVSCSAVCTHLGCIVQWNQAERSWDCPCHGSRFSRTGEVLDGPATAPLEHD